MTAISSGQGQDELGDGRQYCRSVGARGISPHNSISDAPVDTLVRALHSVDIKIIRRPGDTRA